MYVDIERLMDVLQLNEDIGLWENAVNWLSHSTYIVLEYVERSYCIVKFVDADNVTLGIVHVMNHIDQVSSGIMRIMHVMEIPSDSIILSPRLPNKASRIVYRL